MQIQGEYFLRLVGEDHNSQLLCRQGLVSCSVLQGLILHFPSGQVTSLHKASSSSVDFNLVVVMVYIQKSREYQKAMLVIRVWRKTKVYKKIRGMDREETGGMRKQLERVFESSGSKASEHSTIIRGKGCHACRMPLRTERANEALK